MQRPTRKFSVAQWDVFSQTPLEGNSLAVFSDARGLSDAEMQAMAREMNLAETTFILPREPEIERDRGVRVRIFTTQEELPFAGHPTLGTAFALRGQTEAGEIALDLNIGKIRVQFEKTSDARVFGEMTQIDPTFGARHEPEAVARVLGLRVQDFDSSLPIESVSTGVAFTIVPIKSLAIIQNLKIDIQRASEYIEKTGGNFFYVVTRETGDSKAARLHARMFFYNGEDPATGSAAGCAAAWMVAHEVAQPEERVVIEQGLEIRRPSRIFVRAARRDNRIVNVRVGGHAVEVMHGELFL